MVCESCGGKEARAQSPYCSNYCSERAYRQRRLKREGIMPYSEQRRLLHFYSLSRRLEQAPAPFYLIDDRSNP